MWSQWPPCTVKELLSALRFLLEVSEAGQGRESEEVCSLQGGTLYTVKLHNVL